MRRNYLCVPLGALLLLVLAGSPAQAFNEFVISCEGVESTGGGALRYQYTLQNTDAVSHTLERFYLGTNDLNAGNYTNWSAPTGFAPVALVTNWGTVPDHSIMYSSELKTPHGVTPPVLSFASAGVISWSGSVVVPPGGTVTFGYDEPHLSWDVEWLAEHPIEGIGIAKGRVDAVRPDLSKTAGPRDQPGPGLRCLRKAGVKDDYRYQVRFTESLTSIES